MKLYILSQFPTVAYLLGQVMAFTADAEKDLIQVALVPTFGTPATQRIRVRLPELAEVIGDMGVLITVELDLAKLRLRQRRHGDARTLAQRARSLAERSAIANGARATAATTALRARNNSGPICAMALF